MRTILYAFFFIGEVAALSTGLVAALSGDLTRAMAFFAGAMGLHNFVTQKEGAS